MATRFDNNMKRVNMKRIYSLIAATLLSGSALASTDSVTLNEAEKMVNSGKAILIKLPDNAVLSKIKTDADINTTSIACADVNITATQPSIVAIVTPQPVLVPVVVKKDEKTKEGVDISMPTTLKSLLAKMTKITGEYYFCEDDINIPPSHVKLTGIVHLDRYLRQVTNYGIVVTKENTDVSLPKVIKVVRTDALAATSSKVEKK